MKKIKFQSILEKAKFLLNHINRNLFIQPFPSYAVLRIAQRSKKETE